MKFTLYSSNVTGLQSNCRYQNRMEISTAEDLRRAVAHDYVCAEYRNSYRSGGNFISSDCIPFDCDNDHSENEPEWVRPDDIRKAFPGVSFAVHYSRYNMRDKNGRKARPKFHILFPIDRQTDSASYAAMKKAVSHLFPYFDQNALDSARFFFGTQDPEVNLYEGRMNLSEFIRSGADFDLFLSNGRYGEQAEIREGNRNSTLSRYAGRVIKKYGDTVAARSLFDAESAKCSPPLGGAEIERIWQSARKFYERICSDPSYIKPDDYNANNIYKPDDYSDVGQAAVLANMFSEELKYTSATHFIRYNGMIWDETKGGARLVLHELTRRQLSEAANAMSSAKDRLEALGSEDEIDKILKGKKEDASEEQDRAARDYLEARSYHRFAQQRRDAKYITAALTEAAPMLEISPSRLDADWFYLNTPSGTFNLKDGMGGMHEHKSEDLITKITAVSPGTRGEKIWQDCLDTIFQGDRELIDYVQLVCGLAAIGKVFVEAMIIAYGDGRNGKSTFWNTVLKVLGTYGGMISADALTVGCHRNVKPEMAEAKGKRLLIAGEMQEGARLNDSFVKQMCSTDEIQAEKKYKDPFKYTPCHTLVLYTNHLPKVSAADDGIWRRLIVIPFNAKITGNSDIKNYSDYLFENAAESVLSWVIEGAEKVIRLDYRIATPKCVLEAVDRYHQSNDWFAHFLDDRCETGRGLREKSSELYRSYRQYCQDTGEYTRSTSDFYSALEKNGFNKLNNKRPIWYGGLKLRGCDGDFDSENSSNLRDFQNFEKGGDDEEEAPF